MVTARHCEICGAPLETLVTIGGQTQMVPVSCECAVKRGDQERAEIARERDVLRNSEIIRRGYLDPSFLAATFDADADRTSKCSADMQRYTDKWQEMKQRNIGLLLLGGCGSGKTFYASCVANAVRERYRDDVLISSMAKLVRRMTQDFGKHAEEIEIMIRSAGLMVIDDLGVERNTEYAYEQIEGIINMRYSARKPLIVTTNISMDEFKTPQDIRQQRVYSRLSEMCVPYVINGADRRKEIGRAKAAQAREVLGF